MSGPLSLSDLEEVVSKGLERHFQANSQSVYYILSVNLFLFNATAISIKFLFFCYD